MTKTRNKRSLTIAQHRTSVSLEEPFWQALADIAKSEGKSIAGLVSDIDRKRAANTEVRSSLSAAIRLYVLERVRKKNATD